MTTELKFSDSKSIFSQYAGFLDEDEPEQRPSYNADCVARLCQNGDVDGLQKWFDECNKKGFALIYNERAIKYASTNRHCDVLDWWYEHSKMGLTLEYDSKIIISEASEDEHLDVLDWWYKHSEEVLGKDGLRFEYDKCIIAYASRKGHINVLDWWYQHSKQVLGEKGLELIYSYHTMVCDQNTGENINVLNWWLQHSTNVLGEYGLELVYNATAIQEACICEHINVLEWWINSGLEIKFNPSEHYLARLTYRPKVIAWLENNGFIKIKITVGKVLEWFDNNKLKQIIDIFI